MPPIPTTQTKRKYKRFQNIQRSINNHFIRTNPSHQQRTERGRQGTNRPSRQTLSDTRSLWVFEANKVTQHVSDGSASIQARLKQSFSVYEAVTLH